MTARAQLRLACYELAARLGVSQAIEGGVAARATEIFNFCVDGEPAASAAGPASVADATARNGAGTQSQSGESPAARKR